MSVIVKNLRKTKMLKKYYLKLNIPEEVMFNEEEFIQKIIKPIPNGITIVLREINENVDIELNTEEKTEVNTDA